MTKEVSYMFTINEVVVSWKLIRIYGRNGWLGIASFAKGFFFSTVLECNMAGYLSLDIRPFFSLLKSNYFR